MHTLDINTREEAEECIHYERKVFPWDLGDKWRDMRTIRDEYKVRDRSLKCTSKGKHSKRLGASGLAQQSTTIIAKAISQYPEQFKTMRILIPKIQPTRHMALNNKLVARLKTQSNHKKPADAMPNKMKEVITKAHRVEYLDDNPQHMVLNLMNLTILHYFGPLWIIQQKEEDRQEAIAHKRRKYHSIQLQLKYWKVSNISKGPIEIEEPGEKVYP